MSIYRTRRTLKPASMDPARAVPRELLVELLEDAQWAPTHGLTQPWRFQVFFSAAARSRLAQGLMGTYDATTPTARQDESKRAKLGQNPERAAVVIALLAHIDPNSKIAEWEEIAAVSCAAQNLMLSAHEHGLGSFWSSPPAACSSPFVQWLGLDPANHRALGLIYLGWPAPGQAASQSSRVPLEERVIWHEA